MMSPKQSFSVSVVIPAYNAEATIERAIESVLRQTRPPEEIIVVDDGSTDRTAEKVRQYEPKVRYLYELNNGPSNARNLGILSAQQGEWVAFLDADDEWLPEKLECQVNHLSRNPDLLWTFSNYWLCFYGMEKRQTGFEDKKTSFLLKNREYFDDYLDVYAQIGHALTSSMIIRRRVLLEVGLFETNRFWAEDTDLFFRISYRHPQIGYLSNPLVLYYAGYPGSLTEEHKRQIQPRCSLVLKHLALSAQHGRLEKFMPCACKMLENCIRRLLQNNPISDLHEIPAELDVFLPARLRKEVWCRRKWPRAAAIVFSLYFSFKNALNQIVQKRMLL